MTEPSCPTCNDRREVLTCNHCRSTAGDCECGGVWGSTTEPCSCQAEHPPLVYLSGPMTGYPDFNYDAFDQAAARLRAAGYPVFNPTETFGRYQGLSKETYMKVDLMAVEVCDVVVTLPGWDKSVGAIAEAERAWELGKEVVGIDEFLPESEPRYYSVLYIGYKPNPEGIEVIYVALVWGPEGNLTHTHYEPGLPRLASITSEKLRAFVQETTRLSIMRFFNEEGPRSTERLAQVLGPNFVIEPHSYFKCPDPEHITYLIDTCLK